MAISKKLPSRLHHTAYVTKDQERTRQFYEDVIGMPLVATWCESDELFGKVRTYVHTFFGIGDGGALAFFQFADPNDQAEFGPKMPASPFHHIALKVDAETQAGIEARIAKAGIQPPDTYVLEHGYCRSVYVTDPNGLILEFTHDHPAVEQITKDRRADAHLELKRWLAGDHTSNNTYR
jgi:glyoxylase I family protein